MALKINLYKNNNTASKAYGLVYGRVENSTPMDLSGLARHMHDHNSPYDEGVIHGVLIQMVKCIRELALEGQPVKLANLAIIKCQVESTGATSYLNFDLGKNVKAVKLSAVSTGEFSRGGLAADAKLEYTSLAQSLRQAEQDADGGEDGGEDGGDGNNG